jgi:hypothetical protein
MPPSIKLKMKAVRPSETLLSTSSLKTEAVWSSEAVVPNYKTTARCHDFIWEFINVFTYLYSEINPVHILTLPIRFILILYFYVCLRVPLYFLFCQFLLRYFHRTCFSSIFLSFWRDSFVTEKNTCLCFYCSHQIWHMERQGSLQGTFIDNSCEQGYGSERDEIIGWWNCEGWNDMKLETTS